MTNQPESWASFVQQLSVTSVCACADCIVIMPTHRAGQARKLPGFSDPRLATGNGRQ
jgi:hypothetical protein